MMFDNKVIMITGGTGSFGKAFVEELLSRPKKPEKIIIYSRDEMKQNSMREKFSDENCLRFFLGDVRDKERLKRAMNNVDYVIHAAANKIVPIAEYDPFECIKTNIVGAMNVVDCAIDSNVEKVIALSTDKASSPANLYGATKLVSDKVFVSGNNYSGAKGTKFSIVRYGNVMGSRGSVIPFFLRQRSEGVLNITDERMTRFMIDLKQGVELVNFALSDCVGGEIYVKKIPSMKVTDIASTLGPKCKQRLVGIRPGEKIHEEMISLEDSFSTYEYKDYFKILPTLNNWHLDPDRIKDGTKVPTGFNYTSDTNNEWMKPDDLMKWVAEYDETLF